MHTITQRYDGQILNCAYGHRWPLNLYTDGFVRISVSVSEKGNLKIKHVWAETREQLQ